jgi:16S rRNA (guanine527-N7)-methyltransferase
VTTTVLSPAAMVQDGAVPIDADALREVLGRSRQLGLLGPGPIETHIEHAAVLLPWFAARPAGRGLDLGSGGGVPGFVLAVHLPEWSWVLLDSQQKRCDVLVEGVAALGLDERVRVVRARAEDAGRDPDLRSGFDVVVARSFGPPAVTAECGAAFCGDRGSLVVSEPPDPGAERWPPEGLATLGLAPSQDRPPSGWAVFDRVAELPELYPRPNGRPAKRPLWTAP